VTRPTPNADPVSAIDDALGQVLVKLVKDPQVGDYARAYLELEFSDEPAERARQRWERLHLLCLRLPQKRAEELQLEAAGVVQQVLPGPDAATWASDSLSEAIPSLPAIDYRGPGTLHNQELSDELLTAGDGLTRQASWDLIRVAATTCWLYERDRLKEHQVSQNPGLYRKGIGDCINNLVRAQATPDGGEAEFTRVLDLDRWIRSVYPVPFPYAGSWWTGHLQRLMAAVDEHPLTDRIDRPEHLLTQSFQGLRRAKPQKVDEANSVGVSKARELVGPVGQPGCVAWVLRPGYLDKDGAYHPAWVVYVSARD
jgi:hypothetical protein